MENTKQTGLEIAVIGMTGRFPGAKNLDEYWNNLINGMESIGFFTEEELEGAGVTPKAMNDPDYVKAHGELQYKDYFDNSFFGYTPKEIEVMDPQIRVFHECAWQALEEAGYDPTSYKGSIAIYGGGSDNFSWRALEMMKGLGDEMGFFARSLLNNGFLLSTRVSHKLDLKGPSVTFFTACSTSLVAIHLACRALLMGECSIALAGGVSVTNHVKMGYIYEEGMILSPDGHCRTFDAKAKGSVYGEGVGIVVLKRLKQALEDGDTIHAVIKSSAVNNDGTNKASFTAPGISGISTIIKKAMKVARVKPEDISYVEAHGTATPIGDTLEIKSLKKAFNSNLKGYCRIGSVKSNIGHLDTAAGVAGFIKTILAIKHKLIPPSLHFENPNPDIDFENSPFKVNTGLTPWTNGKGPDPLIAGVNGFGIGGNNAFIVVEEPPEIKSSPGNKSRDWKLLLLSARTESALDKMTNNLEEYFIKNLLNHGNHENPMNPGQILADVAYTLQVGRKAFNYRRTLVCRDINDAIEILANPDSRKIKTLVSKIENREIIFMFSGLGSQYVNMGLELYQKEKIFRSQLDRCFEILTPLLEENLEELLYPSNNEDPNPREKMNQIEISQIILFIFEYALARLLIQWGITPQAMIGYSFGEYVAACLSGVLSLEDALGLIVYRGQLIKEVPEGLMLSVPLPKEELIPLLPDELSIGIDNGPSCIVSGPKKEIEAFEKQMKEKRCLCMFLPASHAIHSTMMAPILEKFKEKVGQVPLNKPQIPYISNVTGTWVTFEEVTDPGYWARHLGGTVQFADGVKELVKKPNAIFVEIGPGRDLSALVQRYLDNNSDQRILNLIRPPGKDISDVYFLLSKIGQLWLYGKNIDWSAFYTQEKRHRIPLPTYPFEGQQFLVEGDPMQIARKMLSEGSPTAPKLDVSDWFYVPSWKRIPTVSQRENENSDQTVQPDWLVFMDGDNWGEPLVKQLENKHQDVTIIRVGQGFRKINNREYTINPAEDNQYEKLFSNIREEKGVIPGKMIHLWNITTKESNDLNLESTDWLLDLGYYCLLNIAQAIGKLNIEYDIDITVVTNNMQEVVGGDQRCPGKTTLLGPVKGIPKEYGNISLRSIDILLPQPGSEEEKKLTERLIKEFFSKDHEPVIAFRNHFRWQQTYEPVRLEKSETGTWRLKDGGVYLVTGGLGGIGHVLAQQIVRSVKNSKLILTGRTKLPGREEWGQWLEEHDEEDSISAKITKVRGLEEMGAEVFVGSAESSDLEQMKQVISRAEEQFGPINGVVHSAGLPDGAMIQVRTREHSEILFSAKLKGTLILDMLLKHVKLDFFVLCSSIDSILSNAGHVGYCSANSFLNAFATYKFNKDKVFTAAINWPRWQSLGMAVIQENLHKELKGYDLSGGLEIEDGVDAFSRILGENLPNVAVVSYDLGRAYERDKTVGTEAFMAEFDTAEDDTPGNLFQRPDLTSEYVVPQSEIEQSLAQIWQRLFGIEKIGIQDDFFELGGDSLKVVITISKIHKELDVEIPVSEFFNTPNIRDLAKYITSDISEDKESTYLSIRPAEEKEYYPLSSSQKRFYIIQHMEPGSTAYNETKAVTIQGKFDEHKLEQALKSLLHRHEVYRTSIRLIDENPVQKIHRMDEIELTIAGYHCANEDKARKMVEHFARPFDLSRAPILRIGLITLSDQKYILVMDTHHIVTDKISDGIFVRELLALYRGEEFPGLKIQYKDYAEWQKSDRQQKLIMKQEEYWVKKFAGDIPVLNLPFDYPRPEVVTFEGNSIGFTLEKEELDALKVLALELDVTLYMVLLSFFTILLAKLSGLEDIIIGTPVSGRRHAEIQNSVGLFINTLALRNHPLGKKTYKEFMKEIRENTLKAFDNQDYPIEDLIDRVGVNRDMSRNPLFDVLFVLQNMEEMPEEIMQVDIPDFKLLPFGYETLISRSDLTLEIYEWEEYLSCTFQYSTKLFKRETIVRFVDYFKNIVYSILADSEKTLCGQSLNEITRVSRERKEAIIRQLNRELQQEAVGLIKPGMTLQRKINQSFKKYSSRVAIENGNQIVTYNELSARAGKITRSIIEKGMPARTFIGILLENRVEFISVMIGILNAGCVFVPLDPSYPKERLISMMRTAGIRWLVANETGEPLNTGESVELLSPDHLYSLANHSNDEVDRHTRQWDPGDTIYLYFTSGTTGTPQAILGQNRSLLHFLYWEIRTFDIRPQTRFSQFTTPVFDAFLRDVFVPLISGGVICIPPDKETMLQSTLLTCWVDRSHIHLIHCVPGLFRLLVPGQHREHQADRERETRSKFKELKYILLSGERINPADLAGWYKKFKDRIQLVNLWGTSETTLAKTCYFIWPDDVNRERIPVGKPLPGARVVVLDESLEICDPLVTGQLYIKTPFRTLGYHNEPTLNRERFIPDPFSHDTRVLLHKTGDLGRMLIDGTIDVIGRNDRQVKINGIRVELEEIESVLRRHDRVREAVVLKRKTFEANELLCAYITEAETAPHEAEPQLLARVQVTGTEGSGATAEEEYRRFLLQRLPAYMVPGKLIILENMPRKPNGKVDYDALPDPAAEEKTDSQHPRNRVEEKLLELWSDILGMGIEHIGVTHSFFELGGNSLNIMTLISRIHREFDIRIPLVEIFKKNTIRSISQFIKTSGGEKYFSIPPVEAKEYYNLSPAQKRLYVIHQLDKKSTTYNIPSVVILEGELDKKRFEETFTQLVNRHESTRTSFVLMGREPVQKINTHLEFKIDHYDLNNGDEPGDIHVPGPQDPIIESYLKPFDLSRAPLIRVGMIKLPPQNNHRQHILMLDIHHIISDGVSTGVLVKDFMALYAGEKLAPLNVQYKDFAAWQNRLIESGIMGKKKKYWMARFAGKLPVLEMPTDYPRPPVQHFEGGSIGFTIHQEITNALRIMAAQYGATLYMVLLTIYTILLSKYTGQEDIIIGTPVAGRNHADLENIIGFFINVLPMRNYPEPGKTFEEFLLEVKINTLDAFENQEYQFDHLVEDLGLERDTSRTPLYDVVFTVLNMDIPGIDIPGLQLRPYEVDTMAAKTDLRIAATESEKTIHLLLTYAAALFKKETAQRMGKRFVHIIKQVIDNHRIQIKDIFITDEIAITKPSAVRQEEENFDF